MAISILEHVSNVLELMGDPLPQCPSYARVLAELEAEYQYVTNKTNATGNAWQVNTLTVTTTAGTAAYRINKLTGGGEFYKALSVVTVPADATVNPEFSLEFVELEHIPQEWAWIAQNKGQLYYSSHSSQMIAFYRKITSTGAEVWVEIRPIPDAAQDYKILFQQGEWWDHVTGASTTGYEMPHSTQSRYISSLVARTLLATAKWCFNDDYNSRMRDTLARDLEPRIERYAKAFEDHRLSLESHDVVILENWADGQGVIW